MQPTSLLHSNLIWLTLVDNRASDTFFETRHTPKAIRVPTTDASLSKRESIQSSLLSFLSYGSQNLRRLSLSSDAYHDLTAYFDTLAHLTDLILEHRTVHLLSIPWLSRLTLWDPSSADVLLPKLELLKNDEYLQIEEDAIEAMILSRCHPGPGDRTGQMEQNIQYARLRRVAIKTGT